MAPQTTPGSIGPPGFVPTHVVVHYNEVGLKGRNRPWFEDKLMRNIRKAVAATFRESGVEPMASQITVRRRFGRLLVELGRGRDDAAAVLHPTLDAVRRTFGVAYTLPVVELPPDLAELRSVVGKSVAGAKGVRTFAVKCKRSTKGFPFTSMEVQRDLGAHVVQQTGWTVNLDEPDCIIRVECVNNRLFVGFSRVEGPGGLPTGIAGKVACLLSGGIDSPVAAYRLLRRGATAVYVHFHSHPHTGVESQEKVQELARLVQPPGTRSRLYMVPFADLQRRITAGCSAPLRIVIYRRFMLRAAEEVARKERALALVTGENLGQVASQTLENLQVIDASVFLPVLRPLIGLDKLEIIAEAQKIGTYDVSVEPHDDCCSFLQPRNPATYSTAEELVHEEERFDVSEEARRLVQSSEIIDVGLDPRRTEPHAIP
jgi:thiamine biosynthesis protein ThiI